VEYYPGWDEAVGLKSQLQDAWFKDIKRQHTSVGPQRADIYLRINETNLDKWCSRGQQKLAAAALLLAQLLFLKANNDKNSILLIDDLPSELDDENRQYFLHLVANTKSQSFITATNRDLLQPASYCHGFHVKHGGLEKML